MSGGVSFLILMPPLEILPLRIVLAAGLSFFTELENNPRTHVTPEKTPEIQSNLEPNKEYW